MKAIIHSASNHTCGLAATDAAKRLGIPSIYEIRGFWHYTRASKEDGYKKTDHFKMIHRLEIQAAQNASHVFGCFFLINPKTLAVNSASKMAE